ncbi:uncharacterized protein LOC100903670 [Galendromus occidentalis]|uniref:Uncharacterized protein LOC100903670 n=1 Tax=Galendromus occidentalis TaxID=34638 RepID=A0AAJ6QY12_9ACAR|nr:uncharacterized protein LOC100903670 [Galendromus occidentalis]
MARRRLIIALVILALSIQDFAGAVDTDLIDLYAAHNLPYSCLPYITKSPIPACDCVSCTRDLPSFKDRMCKFFEEARTKGKADALNQDLVNVCTSIKVCNNIPNRCCDPKSAEPKVGKGCPLCLPSLKSELGKKGHNSVCLLAEYEATKPPAANSTGWKDTFEVFSKAMTDVGLSNRCSSYALYKTAKLCDCEDCLQNENDLRGKLCKLGEKIRADEKIRRRGFMRNAYFQKFCDLKACPTIPNKCCANPSSRDEENPVDRQGCPTCIPTTAVFGFGPRCHAAISKLPQPSKLKVFQLP